MDLATEPACEQAHDELVLLDPAQAGELIADHARGEMDVVGALDLGDGTGQRGLDRAFEFGGGGHRVARILLAILPEVMAQEVTYKAQGITFTDIGAQKVQEFLASQGEVAASAGLRVGVKGGGCSGFQYQLAFDEQKDGGVVFENQGLRILVDSPSLPYVDGSQIDYVDSLQGAGFQVNNPNVVAACGCGSSFRVADEEQVSAV